MHFVVCYLSTFSYYCKKFLRIIINVFLLHQCRLQICWVLIPSNPQVLTPRVFSFVCHCLILSMIQCGCPASILVSEQTCIPCNTTVDNHLKKQNHQRTNQPNMTLPFKFLSYEILNNPKLFPVSIYPLYPHIFFIPKPIEKSTTPSKHVTIIYACLGTYDPKLKSLT